MIYKHFYKSITIRLLIVVALSVTASFFLFVEKNYYLCALFAALMSVAAINLINYFNKINRWISFFLLGIENDDTTLKIPSKSGNKTIDEVYNGMKRLNILFKKIKTDINTKEYYYRSIINQASTGLFSINGKGRILNINPKASNLINLNEYQHVNALSKIDGRLPAFIMDQNNKMQSAVFENQYGKKLLFKLSEITVKNEKIKLIEVNDITKELDTREVDAWIKLGRTLSHEIMNSITPITTLSQVILKYFVKNGKIIPAEEIKQETVSNSVKGLKVIKEQSLSLMNFVENYRKFTKLPEPNLSRVNLTQLIENNLMAARTFPGFDSITIKKEIPVDFHFVTDEKLQTQVIINLLKNATEALVSANTPSPTLLIKLWKSDNTANIEIANNGPAIPAGLREQIFVPFYTTKANGSGIGLSLSKQIMLSMGGDIILNNNKNGWTSFVITMSKRG